MRAPSGCSLARASIFPELHSLRDSDASGVSGCLAKIGGPLVCQNVPEARSDMMDMHRSPWRTFTFVHVLLHFWVNWAQKDFLCGVLSCRYGGYSSIGSGF